MTAAVLQHFESGMSEAEYRQERERIAGLLRGQAASAFADQALAALFIKSGWRPERLAEAEGKSRDWAELRLRFGRFLDFPTYVGNPEWTTVLGRLTEFKFRSYWSRADPCGGNEYQRFALVQRALLDDLTIQKSTRNKPKEVGRAVAALADGKWHREDVLITHAQEACAKLQPPIEVTPDDLRAVLHGMVKNGTFGVHAEKKKGAKGWMYRLVRSGRTIDLDVFMMELGPILDGLKAEGAKNMATMSPGTVAHLTYQLERLIDKLAKQRDTTQRSEPAPKE